MTHNSQLTTQNLSIHWFRRDLRLHDNAALYHALKSGLPVLPIFIFDTNIFGKTIRQLVEEGIQSKVNRLNEESQIKLQETIQKVVNDSNGGLVCIII